MIIETQRGRIVNFDNVEDIYPEGASIIAELVSGNRIYLGEYYKDGNVDKVMHMIEEAYENFYDAKDIWSNGKACMKGTPYTLPEVFHMPKESKGELVDV